MPWLRLWDDALDSPKVHRLKPDLFRAWIFFLLAAKRHNCGGALPDVETIAFWMHAPEAQVQAWTDALIAAGLIEESEHGPTMHDWEHWQQPPDRTAAQRMRRMRETRKSKAAKSAPPVPPSEESRTEERRREDVTPTVTPSVTGSVTPSVTSVTLRRNTAVTHDTDSPAARQVVSDASRHWGEVDLDAEIQANELIRCFGAETAGAALDKAFKALGPRQRPWAYATKLCREGITTASVNGRHRPSEPQVNQPATAMNPPPGLEAFAAESAVLMAKYEEQQARRRKSS